MTRLVLAITACALSMMTAAQGHSNYLSASLGQEFLTGHYHVTWQGAQILNAEVKGEQVYSLDGGHYFSDHFGIHLGLFNSEESDTYSSPVSQYLRPSVTVHSRLTLVEVGPEFAFYMGDNIQLFSQLNLGYTLSGSSLEYRYQVIAQNGSSFTIPVKRDVQWVYGVAAGFRLYFGGRLGVSVLVAYHHVGGWLSPSGLDARAGVSFRF